MSGSQSVKCQAVNQSSVKQSISQVSGSQSVKCQAISHVSHSQSDMCQSVNQSNISNIGRGDEAKEGEDRNRGGKKVEENSGKNVICDISFLDN